MSHKRFERRTDSGVGQLTGTLHGSVEKEINAYAKVVGKNIQFLTIYAVPDDHDPTANIVPDELLQVTGRDGRFTVEMFRLEGDQIRTYVVGRREESTVQETTETVFNGPNPVSVRPNEVLTLEQATQLLHHYYEQNADLDDAAVSLRELPEFSRTIDYVTNAGNQPKAEAKQSSASPSTDGVDLPLNLGQADDVAKQRGTEGGSTRSQST